MTAAERFREEGIVLGFKQGLEQGIEQGIALGIKQSKVEMVINCLNEGTHIGFIVKVMGLTKAEIIKIAQEHQVSIN